MLDETSRGRLGGRALRVACCAALLLSACGADDRRESSALPSTMGRPAAMASNASPASDAAADEAERELLARGEILSFACRPCHGLAAGDESPQGPHLHGVFGRLAGTREGFDYSPALRDSGIVWTAETLDAWLAQPDAFLPGNEMAFAGFRSADDRRALIAYLREVTAAEETAAESDEAAGDEASD
ncbi:MAG TPA: cytochrome c family protein [Gammaproteobacteria bacterium]